MAAKRRRLLPTTGALSHGGSHHAARVQSGDARKMRSSRSIRCERGRARILSLYLFLAFWLW